MSYHISLTTGRPNKCTATKRACPVGGPGEHFETKEEARAAYEAKHSSFDSLARKRTVDAVFPGMEKMSTRGSSMVEARINNKPSITMETVKRDGEEVGVAYANGREVAVFRHRDHYEALVRASNAHEWSTIEPLVANNAEALEQFASYLDLSPWSIEKEIDNIETAHDEYYSTSLPSVRKLNRDSLKLAQAALSVRLTEEGPES